jgi:hypothetical protein
MISWQPFVVIGEVTLRSLLTTGLVVMATVLGTLAVVPTASAAPAGTAVPGHAAVPAHATIPGHAATPAVAAATPPAQNFTQLGDTSCFHIGDCLAVGQHYSGKSAPVGYQWNGTRWAANSISLPSGASQGFLTSLACWSTGCVAVGSFDHGTTGYGLAEYYTNSHWTTLGYRQPATISNASDIVLESVACMSSTDCVAAGFYVPSSNKNTERAIAEVWNGSGWTVSDAPTAAGAQFSNLDTISCPAVGYCVLGGQYVTSAAPAGFYVWAEKFTNNKTWQALSVAQPTTVNAHDQFFNGVSCSSTTSCVGVGESVNTADHISAFTEVLAGGGFHGSKITWPANSQSSLNAVSCPTATTYCIAVGGLGAFQTLTGGKSAFAIYNGTNNTWALHYAPAPKSGNGNDLYGVHCLSSAYCVLAGTVGKANTDTGTWMAGVFKSPTWTWQPTSLLG